MQLASNLKIGDVITFYLAGGLNATVHTSMIRSIKNSFDNRHLILEFIDISHEHIFKKDTYFVKIN